MAFPCYLAMTAAEFASAERIPAHMAWMACHFSPYSTGLSGIPRELPPDAMVILNDRTPIHGHDPRQIAAQLEGLASKFGCSRVLLDFQRPGEMETAAVAQAVIDALPCPVGVTPAYGKELDVPLLLPPPPPDTSLPDYLAPWQGRELWLEAALGGIVLTVTPKGTTAAPLPFGEPPPCPHREEGLHCHYRIDLKPNQADFTLTRTPADLGALLEEAEGLGVTLAVGLYQELGNTK